jgi:hypothetical protein
MNPDAIDIDWNQIVFSLFTATSAHVAASSSSEDYYGEVDVYFTLPESKTALDTLIVYTNLGEIDDKEQKTIQDAIIAANKWTASNIDWEQIKISAITESDAHVAALDSSEDYYGEVDVHFSLPVKTNIDTFIEITTLGEITDNDQDTILQAIIVANRWTVIGVDWDQIVFSLIKENSAHVAASSSSRDYCGEVDVTFDIVP